MSKEKRRVPKLRFPGFTEDWEQRKANYIFNSVTDKGYPELPVLSASQELGMVYRDQNGIDIQHDKKNETSYKRVLPGQFVIHLRSFQGGFAYSEVEGITSPAYTVMSFKNSSEQYGLFWKHVFKSETFIKRLETITYGIRDGRSISFSDFKSLILQYPSFSEQKLIGGSIEIIESGITLHQRKLDNLKLKKKALLQKLFPKNGERYPELRFPGFTDAWEQRKLNEFLSVSNFKNTENKYNKKDVLSVSGDYGIVNQIDFQGRSFAGASVSNYGVVEKGDIVYTKSPLKLNPYGIIKTNRLNNGIVSTLYAIYKTKENCNSKFIEHYFNLDSRLNQYLKPLVNKGAKNDMKVSSENVLIGEVCFPKITEQALIADFLDCLDIYITLHQRKLEHLKLQKKALLQQMFV